MIMLGRHFLNTQNCLPKIVLIKVASALLAILILSGNLIQMRSNASIQVNSTTQLPLPTKTGEVFIIDDFNNKVTRNDLGFDYFGGNTGATESASVDPTRKITTELLSPDSNGSPGGSLQIAFDFTGQTDTSFAGYFLSLFGLTDSKVSLDGSGVEPPNSTPFANYFLDTRDIYRDFLPLPDRSVDLLQFDMRLVAGGLVKLKIELKDENGSFVFARREITGTEWQTHSLALPNDFDRFTGNQPFDWRRVSVLSFIVERVNVADNVVNPTTGSFRIDNVRLQDSDGAYPDFNAAQDSAGGLAPQFTNAFLDLVRATSSLYFLDFASTDARAGGIVQDRSTFADLLSVGGAGFQLTDYVISAERGYVTRENAAARTKAVLKVLHDAPQGPDRVGKAGHKGFFYHFLGIDGRRKQNFDFAGTQQNESRKTVELSTIDTALVIAGALTARQYFNGNDPTETGIRMLADAIYERVDWPFMLNTTCGRNAEKCNQFYLGWKPNETREGASFEIPDLNQEGQYSGTVADPATLDVYTDESVLVSLLAVASPSHPVPPSVFFNTKRLTQGGTFFKTFPGSLFTYQFASVWLDTAALGSDLDPTGAAPRINYFANTKDAITATRQYTIANPLNRATWSDGRGELLWGLSATEGPFDDYFSEAAPPAALHLQDQCLGSGGPLSLEAETGTGNGTIMARGAASGQQTVLLLAGEARTLSFNLDGTALYECALRYSNDGAPDNISVSIDGNVVGQFSTQNTRPAGGEPGSGWNMFLLSGPVESRIISPGSHQITISVTGDDPFGVEIDLASLTPKPVTRPLEIGTVTVYGAGSAIIHTPNEAVESLWMSQTLNLLHPRFGFADAFNINVADAVIPGCIDQGESRILRASGPWANFNGYAIDHGPMAVMIDNFLHQNFVPKLFMSHLPIRLTLMQIFPSAFQFSAVSVNVGEDAGHVDITVKRDNNVSGAATVHYATSGGTASDRTDYTAALGTLHFSDGEMSKTVSVLLTDDAFVEGNETINVVLTEPQGGPTLGNPSVAVITIVDNDTAEPTSNPIDDERVFVRQHYHDFLNREPDPPGFDFWTNEISSCGQDAQCREIKRINVSAAFFLSIEFQNTGYLVYRVYKAAYGDATSPNVPGTVPVIRLSEFLSDTQMIGLGVVVGQGNWEQQLESNKNAYGLEFVSRQRLLNEFPTSLTPAHFVDKLRQNTGGALSQAERDQLVSELTGNNTNAGRASVLRKVAEDEGLRRDEFNRAFVLMQYYGYLRRNPDDPQDTDFRGWKFWLDKLNQFGGNFINAEMVKAFIASIEYRQRFGP
jgi:hypothetical protein